MPLLLSEGVCAMSNGDFLATEVSTRTKRCVSFSTMPSYNVSVIFQTTLLFVAEILATIH